MKLKKTIKKILIFILILLILALGGAIYYFNFYKGEEKEIKVIKEIKEYGYKLRENESGYYKKTFQKLEKLLKKDEIDEKEYVKTISKLFIIDFYSLDNKLAKTDVGGVDFIEDSIRSNFLQNAENTYYKYVESDMYGKRTQNLPEVDKVIIDSVEQKEFSYNDKTDSNAYFVKTSWEYKTKAKGYQNSAELVFVHDGKKLVLVELK